MVQRGLIVEDLVSWIFSANPILSNASVEISPVAWSLVPEAEQVQAASTFCVKCRCIQQNKCDPGFLLTFRSGLAYKKFTFSESARSHFQLQSLSGLKFGFYAVSRKVGFIKLCMLMQRFRSSWYNNVILMMPAVVNA